MASSTTKAQQHFVSKTRNHLSITSTASTRRHHLIGNATVSSTTGGQYTVTTNTNGQYSVGNKASTRRHHPVSAANPNNAGGHHSNNIAKDRDPINSAGKKTKAEKNEKSSKSKKGNKKGKNSKEKSQVPKNVSVKSKTNRNNSNATRKRLMLEKQAFEVWKQWLVLDFPVLGSNTHANKLKNKKTKDKMSEIHEHQTSVLPYYSPHPPCKWIVLRNEAPVMMNELHEEILSLPLVQSFSTAYLINSFRQHQRKSKIEQEKEIEKRKNLDFLQTKFCRVFGMQYRNTKRQNGVLEAHYSTNFDSLRQRRRQMTRKRERDQKRREREVL